jgi:carbonic anhydrase
MKPLQRCLDANRAWAARSLEHDPTYFERLSQLQAPKLLWIGCSDSRLPPNELLGLAPGELFVHRNVANIVVHTDINCLSVLQFGIEVLGVEHVIVCGHYGCGGVGAAVAGRPLGLIDNWLRHIKDVYSLHREELERIRSPEARTDRLCELNVQQQVANVCHTTTVQDAWRRGQTLTVHGWILSLRDGLVRDLEVAVERPEQLEAVYRMESASVAPDACVNRRPIP